MNKKVFNPKSKTHWLGTATAIIGALFEFAPQMMGHIPEAWYGPIFITLGVSITILRNVTTMPIDQK